MTGHQLAILGLLLNIAGSVWLLAYPPVVKVYTPDGSESITWVGKSTPEGKVAYARQRRGLVIGFLALILGFGLQLADLILN